jgi:hypothetical protein
VREPSGGFSMTWWKRIWVTAFVAIAIAVVATGVVVVRRVLDHSIDPKALMQISATRLVALDPSLPGLTRSGTDQIASVDCVEKVCASAGRAFTVLPKTTAAAVQALADLWAGESGLGSKSAAQPDQVACGSLAFAPTRDQLCELRAYDVPGVDGQQVIVYAEVVPVKGPAPTPGPYPIAALAKLYADTVWVQVLTSVPAA